MADLEYDYGARRQAWLDQLLGAKQLDLFLKEVQYAEVGEQGPIGPVVQPSGEEDPRF